MPFEKLLNQVIEEYGHYKTIFGVPEKYFYRGNKSDPLQLSGERLGLPLGPAAGPHTQMAQNLAAAYLTGGRFFELKTVQILDELQFPKPCIYAYDEGYNTEWSTELSIEDAFDEYVKGWFLIHFIALEIFGRQDRDFIFNMSVGYDLKGIQSPKVDCFIEGIKDAGQSEAFEKCKIVLRGSLDRFKKVNQDYIENISPNIGCSIALSTMHGCPPAEIEAICKYLLREKGLHVHVKLNPTLLGFDFVRQTCDQMGYGYLKPAEAAFREDLAYDEALPLLQRLTAAAGECGKEFGVKLSNTLPVEITGGELPGEQMYLSGRPLYPLTINLASRLAGAFKGRLPISYSGGADRNNFGEILQTGIKPVTMVTTLLKPAGYQRMKKLAEIAETAAATSPEDIDLERLKQLAGKSVSESTYQKQKKKGVSSKEFIPLPLFDCRASCVICAAVCPNRANVVLKVKDEAYQYDQQILHLDYFCNECGNCATFCPEAGKPYLEKPTLFSSEADFYNSSNQGYYYEKADTELKIIRRVEGEVKQMPAAKPDKAGGSDLEKAFNRLIRLVEERYAYLL